MFFGLVSCTQLGIHGIAQIHFADIDTLRRITTKILNVDHPQSGVLHRQLIAGSPGLVGQLRRATDHAGQFERLGTPGQRLRTQTQAGATIIKAALEYLDAPVLDGMVHLGARLNFLARHLVVDNDIAGKQFGHARGVVLHNEFFEFDGER